VFETFHLTLERKTGKTGSAQN